MLSCKYISVDVGGVDKLFERVVFNITVPQGVLAWKRKNQQSYLKWGEVEGGAIIIEYIQPVYDQSLEPIEPKAEFPPQESQKDGKGYSKRK